MTDFIAKTKLIEPSHLSTATLAKWPWIDVKADYSAVGDGLTDDTTAIQNAFNAISSTGGTIIFPPGSYSVTSEITTGIKPYLHIYGYGASLLGANITGAVLRIGDGTARMDEVKIEGLRISPSGTTTTGLQIQYCPGVLLQNIRVDGTATNGVLLYAGWVGTLENSQVNGVFTYCIKADICPVTGYKNNGFTVRGNWIDGKTTSSYGLYINDGSNNFRSINNYYQDIATVGIYAASAVFFESNSDMFESVTKLGYSANANVRWLNVSIGSNVTDGIEITSDRAILTFNQGSTQPTNNYVDFSATADDGYAEVPSPTKWSDAGSNNIVVDTNNERIWRQGNLKGSGAGPALYGFFNERVNPIANAYTILATNCGALHMNSSATGNQTYTLPAIASGSEGLWFPIQVKTADYSITIAPDSGDKISGLPADQEIVLYNTGTIVCLECIDSDEWYIRYSVGQIEVPLDADTTLGKGAMQPCFLFTNRGAGAQVTVVLPVDEIGACAKFVRVAAQTVIIDPADGVDLFRGKLGGKYKSLDTDGAMLAISCATSNVWEIEWTAGTVGDE